MVTDKFLAREKKALLVKISKYLSKRLTEIKENGEIQDIEIMQITGWTNTRISEIRNYDKYQIRIPEKHLTALIMKGIITVSELKRNLDLNVKESEYIDSLRIYGLFFMPVFMPVVYDFVNGIVMCLLPQSHTLPAF